jgi:hypothetical protein
MKKKTHNTSDTVVLVRTGAITLATFTGLLVILSGGCSDTSTGSAASMEQPTVSSPVIVSPSPSPKSPVSDTNAGPGGPSGTNTAIAEDINTRIVRNTQMTGSRVTAVVDDTGIATLNGFVQNQQQKALAAKAAENTPGVLSIKNKIEIRPTGGVGKQAPTPPPTTQIIVMPAPSSNATPTPEPSVSPSPNWGEPLESYPAPSSEENRRMERNSDSPSTAPTPQP